MHLLMISSSCGGKLRIQAANRRRNSRENRLDDRASRFAAKRRPARRHFVQQKPQRENVGARIEIVAANMLRRHVSGSAADDADDRNAFLSRFRRGIVRRESQSVLGNKFGQAEIEHLRLPALRDENVRRFDVAMNDALGVRGVDGVRDLNPEVENLFDRDRVTVQVLAQRFAVDELHRDERRVVLLADVVDRADARMVQCGRGQRFAAKALQCLRILRHAVGQELQRDRALQPRIGRLVDDTHSSSTEFLQDAKVRNGPVNHDWASVAATGDSTQRV